MHACRFIKIGEVEADETERLIALEADGDDAARSLGGLPRGEPFVELSLVLESGQDAGRRLL
eukprot:1341113-Prymnesium_polylepis.1